MDLLRSVSSLIFPSKMTVDIIMQRIKNGDIDYLKKSMEDHPEKINEMDTDCRTYLMAACEQGKAEIIKLLLDAGADMDIRDRNGRTALHYAVENCKPEFVFLLVSRGADANQKDEDGNTPLHLATCSGKKEKAMVTALLETKGITILKVNQPNNDGRKPLHNACSRGHTDIVRLLLNHKLIDTNVVDNDGNTPLHLAVQNKRYDVVTLMLSKVSVKLGIRNYKRMTPLHDAVCRGHLGMIHNLIEKGADVHAVDIEDNNCLHLTVNRDVFHSEKDVVHILDKCCAELKLGKEERLSGVVVARYLASKGANFYHKNKEGMSPLDLIKDLNLKEKLQTFLLSRCRWCQERKANVKFLPCQHSVICKDCCCEMTFKRCPMCRRNITMKKGLDSQKLEERDLLKVARQLGSNWWQVGIFLGIQTKDLEVIRCNFPNNIREQSYQMLYTWFTACDPQTRTLQTLREALEQVECPSEDI